MIVNKSFVSRLCNAVIYLIITLVLVISLYPLLNTIAISLSSNAAAASNKVLFIPIDFTLDSYKKILDDNQFWRSFEISVIRVLIGTILNMVLAILAAYPLSKSKREFSARNIYMNIFVFCMIFNGGLVPTYLLVKNLHLIDTIWSLVFPGAVQVFNCILLMHFFRSIPKSLEEAAEIDGASAFCILVRVVLPISLPSLATIALFCIVMHWNDYFSALIYINRNTNYPLQTYIQQLAVANFNEITDPEQLKHMANMSNKTLNAAKIVITTIPLLVIYPFLQKYFVHGLMIGSVKE